VTVGPSSRLGSAESERASERAREKDREGEGCSGN